MNVPAYARHRFKRSWQLLRATGITWFDNSAPQVGAALAYYSVFSLGPLLAIVIAVAGIVFGEEAVRGEIMRQLQAYIGDEGAQGLQAILKSAHKSGVSYIAAVTGVLALIIAATGIVVELKKAINHIWKVDTQATTTIRSFAERYIASIAFILGLGFLLMVSFILTTALSSVGKFMSSILPFGEVFLQWLNFGLSFAVITVLFAFMFKWLPDTKVRWRDVWISSLLTATLFNIGKTLIAAYIGTQAFSSTYGAVGGFLALLIWMYYSSQILLFGATFSAVYARQSEGTRARDPAERFNASNKSSQASSTSISPIIVRKIEPLGNDLPAPTSAVTQTRKDRHIGRWMLATTVVLLIGFRISLPYVVESYLNNQLDQMVTYTGHIEDVDISLWRGAYQINGVTIVKRTAPATPLFAAPSIEMSLYWSKLLDFSLVGRIEMKRPEVNFVDSKKPERRQTGNEESWDQVIGGLMPIRLDYFGVHEGKIHLRNFDKSPPIDIYLSDVKIDATNLTNSLKVSETRVAEIEVTAKAMDQADVDAHVTLDPLSSKPDFDLQFKMTNLNLKKLSPFMRAYTSVDFERGFFDLVTEASVHKNKISGYMKPIVRDFKILDWQKDKKKGVAEVIEESVIAAAMQVFKNQKKDQFATRVPLEGSLSEKETDIWVITKNIFRNAFVKAFEARFDSNGKKVGPDKST